MNIRAKKIFHDMSLLILGFILTTVVGGILTQRYQENAWRHQHEMNILESERQAATDVFKEISRLMDSRLYRMRRLITGIVDGQSPQIMQERWDSYREILLVWNENLNRNFALTQRYFGDEARRMLEYEIHHKFNQLGLDIEKRARQSKGAKSFKEFSTSADEINSLIYKFDVTLIRAIQTGKIGYFRPGFE